jgi:hypothetical protein
MFMYAPRRCRFTASHSAPPESHRSVLSWPSASREGRSPHSSATSCQLSASCAYMSRVIAVELCPSCAATFLADPLHPKRFEALMRLHTVWCILLKKIDGLNISW